MLSLPCKAIHRLPGLSYQKKMSSRRNASSLMKMQYLHFLVNKSIPFCVSTDLRAVMSLPTADCRSMLYFYFHFQTWVQKSQKRFIQVLIYNLECRLIGPVEAVDVSTSHHRASRMIRGTQWNKCLKSEALSVIMEVI